jgi:hypothetical protein
MALALVLVTIAAPAYTCVIDAYEPDDSSSSANILVNNSNQSHSICPIGDEDWVSFTLTVNSGVVIETQGATGDTRLYLHDNSINQIEFNDDGGVGFFSKIDRTCATDPLPAGTYFVKIDEFGNDGSIDAYDISLTAVECIEPVPDIRIEPLDLVFDASSTSAEAAALARLATLSAPRLPLDRKVYFKRGTVDPGIARALNGQSLNGSARRHRLMQFEREPTAEEREQLARQGIKLLAYLPNRTYWVSVTQGDMAMASTTVAGGVRWSWVPAPSYKISEDIDAGQFPPTTVQADGRVRVQVLLFADVDRQDATALLDGLAADISVLRVLSKNLLEVLTPISRITEIADLDAVRWVEPAKPPRAIQNATAASRIYADVLRAAPYSVDAAPQTVGIWDQGAIDAHPDFDQRLNVLDQVDISSHATHVAGTVGGSGAGRAAATGMAPTVQLRSYDWNNDLLEVRSAATSTIVISNHSYSILTGWYDNGTTWVDLGSSGFGLYDSDAQEFDAIVYDTDILVFKAAGNDRTDGPDCPSGVRCDGPYDSIPHVGNAKNIVTVCALSDTDVMTSFSSWGPTDDGRIKPDLCANGTSLLSTLPGGTYGYKDGTSMASPSAAGAAALIRQHYQNQTSLDPSPALIKALMIQTARDLGTVGPDYQHGWGIIDAQRAADLITAADYIETFIPASTDQHEFSFDVTGGDIKMTLVWTDPAGDPAAAKALVNDLDLVLIAPDGTPFYPWVLDPANPALAAVQGINNTDNIEQVVVSNAAIGTWTARVSGSMVPIGPQSYALVGEGISASNTRVVRLHNDGNAPLSVTAIVPESAEPWITAVPMSLNVAVGEVYPVLVQVDFTQAPGGISSSRLLVYSDDPDENPYPGGINVSVTNGCLDSDGDGVCDASDNCTLIANAAQRNTDGDAFGNMCDPDFNNDLIVNAIDLAYFKTRFFTTDADADLSGDGIVNAADLAILKSMFFQPPGPSGSLP